MRDTGAGLSGAFGPAARAGPVGRPTPQHDSIALFDVHAPSLCVTIAFVEIAPTKGAQEVPDISWAERRALARMLRVAIAVLPAVASIAATWLLRSHLLRPDGAAGTALWVVQLAAVGFGVALVTERALRRFIPLTHLLRLSLVFPDHAPSRFGVALRTGTIKQQQRVIANVRDHGFSSSQLEAFEQLVAMVMALGHHERLTRGHTERVRAYSALIGEEMGLPEADRRRLNWAALIHDVGKLGVSAEILSLDGRPSDEQWQELKRHPEIGAAMVEPFADWLGEWRLAAGEHHERWDGGGYPGGLAGVDISLAGRIVAVADAYDVITSARSYKKAMSGEAARAELVRCAGNQFDPAVVQAMLRVSVGKLHAVGGRFAWASTVPGVLSSAGQNILAPAAVVAGLLGVPIALADPSLADIVGVAVRETLDPSSPAYALGTPEGDDASSAPSSSSDAGETDGPEADADEPGGAGDADAAADADEHTGHGDESDSESDSGDDGDGPLLGIDGADLTVGNGGGPGSDDLEDTFDDALDDLDETVDDLTDALDDLVDELPDVTDALADLLEDTPLADTLDTLPGVDDAVDDMPEIAPDVLALVDEPAAVEDVAPEGDVVQPAAPLPTPSVPRVEEPTPAPTPTPLSLPDVGL